MILMSVVLCVIVVAAFLLWLIPGPCKCEKCGFHVNERRMEKERQKALLHDVAHKGFGFREGDKDAFKCADAECDRNPKRVD